MTFRRGRLFVSLLVGSAFALLTWMMIGNHTHPMGRGFESLGDAIMMALLPGIFAGFAVSGNIHAANAWIVALGNFLFYFGLAYLLLAIQARVRAGWRGPSGRR